MYKPFQETLSFDDVLLTPQYSEIASRKNVNLKTNLAPNKNFILDIPIISANMDTVTESKMAIAMGKLGGLGLIHRFNTISHQIAEIKKVKQAKVKVGAVFGVKDEEFERARALVKGGADIIGLDIAHAHSKRGITMIKRVRKAFPKAVILAGNVATSEGFYGLAKAGVDIVKVGIGGGSVCITRIVTGAGAPTLAQVLDCAPVARKMKVGLIADGGIRTSGDIVKALAAGADAVLLGNMLAGSEETPGRIIIKKGKKFKHYRGEASLSQTLERPDKKNNKRDIIVEGISAYVSYKGKVADVVQEILGGIRSGLSYGGAHNIPELQRKAVFIRITPGGLRESNSHDVI